MDSLDHVGAREHEQVVVAGEIPRVAREPLAAEVGLPEPAALDHRPHRAVEDQDALPQRGVELRAHAVTLHLSRVHETLECRGPAARNLRGGLHAPVDDAPDPAAGVVGHVDRAVRPLGDAGGTVGGVPGTHER